MSIGSIGMLGSGGLDSQPVRGEVRRAENREARKDRREARKYDPVRTDPMMSSLISSYVEAPDYNVPPEIAGTDAELAYNKLKEYELRPKIVDLSKIGGKDIVDNAQIITKGLGSGNLFWDEEGRLVTF